MYNKIQGSLDYLKMNKIENEILVKRDYDIPKVKRMVYENEKDRKITEIIPSIDQPS